MNTILSYTEENYLKYIFKIGADNGLGEAGTNELANYLSVKPASVNEMLKKMKEKKLVNYEKYGKIKLTKMGEKLAIDIVRKHRLWETFLYEKLEFSWDEVHEVAEELEHINSKKLINKLDKFLEYPEYDPHGNPIPNDKGVLKKQSKKTLSEIEVGKSCKMVAVKDNSSPFLQYVVKVGLGISSKIKVVSKQAYDANLVIEVKGVKHTVSQKFAQNIFVVTEIKAS